MVVIREGYTFITESRVIICDLDYKGRWYVINSGGFKGVLKVYKSKNMCSLV